MSDPPAGNFDPPPPRTAWTAAEIMAMDFPEPRWAVPGIVAEGVTLLAGSPKVGKSWLCLNLAVSVASGGRALGKVDVTGGDVLYLALEDNPRRLQSRLGKVLARDPAPERLTFTVACEALPAGGADRIAAWLDNHPDARLVVVDVFARVRGAVPKDMSSYDADYLAMGRLKTLADRYGVAILVVHHTRKAVSEDFLDAVSGTNGLAGSADAVTVLKRARGEHDAELHLTGRDVEEAAYALTFDPALGAWQMLDGPAEDYALSDTRRAILRHVREHGSASPKQMADTLGMGYELVKKTARRMSDDDQLDTDGQGSYFLPVTLSPLSPLSLTEGDGDTGDTRDTPTGDVP